MSRNPILGKLHGARHYIVKGSTNDMGFPPHWIGTYEYGIRLEQQSASEKMWFVLPVRPKLSYRFKRKPH